MLELVLVKKFLRAPLFVFVIVLAANVNAQVAPNSKIHQDMSDPQIAAARVDQLHKNSRFLGWKYSAQHPEMSAKWLSLAKQRSATPNRAEASGPAAQGQNSTFPYPGFAFLPSLPTGFIPTAVVEGDFNGDGHMDVAISNGGDNTVYVLLGNGDGTFRVPEILYTQGQSPVWITAVSLRNNGHLDLAVADGDSNTVEIFLGKGDGTFQQGVQMPVQQTPTFVLALDSNKDGKQDIAVGFVVDPGVTAPQFQIFLGDGAGGFSGSLLPPPITNGGDDPLPTSWIAKGDVNNDGFTDLVTTVIAAASITYLNQAGISFTQGTPFMPDDFPGVTELGDMDEDGCLDAVELGDFGFITIAKGTCDGNFTQGPRITGLGDLEAAVRVVDVNGDGHLDVVGSAINFGAGGEGVGSEAGYLVSVLEGDGKGNLGLAKIYRGGLDAFSLVVADFTGDNRPEILTADSSENRATLFINDGNGNYLAPQGEFFGTLTGALNSTTPVTSVETVDLNGDGKPDILFTNFGSFSGQPSVFIAMLNDGTGKFQAPIRSNITAGPAQTFSQFVPGIFRNSHTPDAVYITTEQNTTTNVVAFLPGNGDGTFGAAVTLANLSQPLEVVTGDFNGDGKLDFAVVGTNTDPVTFVPIWEFDVFLGHGDGTFNHLQPQKFPINNGGGIQQLFAIDLNHDGKLDLLIGNNDNGGWTNNDDLIEALGNGDGTFQTPTTLIPHFGPVAVADVNHDGFPDLISWRDPTLIFNLNIDSDIFFTPSVTVYLGTASGTFLAQPTYHLPGIAVPSFAPLLVGDFDGDGNPDIATLIFQTTEGGTLNRQLHILRGNGDGTFTVTNHVFQLQGQSDPFIGADFNTDGATDLVEFVGFTQSIHTIPASSAPPVDIALNSDPIVGSAGGATVTLDEPAAGSRTVTLLSSDPAVQLPSSLNFTAGQQSMNFSFTLGAGFDVTHVLALSAQLGTYTATGYAAKPNPNLQTGVLASLVTSSDQTFNAQTVTAGESFSFILQLASEAGYYGNYSSFLCTGLPVGASCSFAPSSVPIYGGENGSVTVSVSTSGASPQGTFPIQVSATDGFAPASASFQLGIGTFNLKDAAAPVVTGPTGSNFATVTSTSTNGLAEVITLTCTGLPPGASCQGGSSLNANGGSTGLVVTTSNVAAADYPFQIVGSTADSSQTVSATLRVGAFSATLNNPAATLSGGQSANFNLMLTSINHYANQITVTCPPPVNTITCTATPVTTNLTDSAAPTVMITISVAAGVAKMAPPQTRPILAALIALVCLAPILVLVLRKQARYAFAYATVLIAFAMLSCAGGGSSTPVVTPPSSPPSQSFNILVTATATTTGIDSLDQHSAGPIVITVP
jgi:hypothetical protein